MTGSTWTTAGLKIMMHRLLEADGSMTYSRPSQFKIGSNSFNDPGLTDTALDKPIALDDGDRTNIDACDATTGWGNSADALAEVLNTTTKKEGTGALDLGKDGVASSDFFYTKTIGAFNLSASYFYCWLYVTDATALAKLETQANGGVRLYISDDGFTSHEGWNSDGRDTLSVGVWNLIFADATKAADYTAGTIDNTAVTEIRLHLVTNNNGDTLASGKVEMDYFHRSTKASTLISMDASFPTYDDSDIKSTGQFTVGFNQANGYSVDEFGFLNSDSTPLLASRDRTSAYTVTSKVKLVGEQVDKYQNG